MTGLRVLGLIVLVFLISFPVTFVVHHGLPALEWAANDDEDKDGDDPGAKDDPVVDIYCLKGLAAMGNGEFEKAITAYTEAISRDPKYSFAYIGRGDAYLAKGDLDRALLDYDQALRLDPDNDAAKVRAAAIRKEKANP
jgi:tetratricopeptide (TPR) repeat protein